MNDEPLKIYGTLSVGVIQANLQNEKTVNPDIQLVEVRADQDYDGLKRVYVNPVTSNIDSNIVAGNIKEGVEILGVTGTYEQGYFTSVSNNTLVFDNSDRPVSVNESELILE